MTAIENDDILQIATEHFEAGNYSEAEPLLNQLILRDKKRPEVFYMMGSVYFDQGKFNKAIRSFKRSLEIDPGYTDASVGLSIILNDLGKYDEGKEIFEEAKQVLANNAKKANSNINERIASKHDELGELYYNYGRYQEALEQYKTSLKLSTRRTEIIMNIVRCYEKLDELELSIRLLRDLVKEQPSYTPARLKLGQLYYEARQIPEAVEQWEEVLEFEPSNSTALDLLTMAQNSKITHFDNPLAEI